MYGMRMGNGDGTYQTPWMVQYWKKTAGLLLTLSKRLSLPTCRILSGKGVCVWWVMGSEGRGLGSGSSPRGEDVPCYQK